MSKIRIRDLFISRIEFLMSEIRNSGLNRKTASHTGAAADGPTTAGRTSHPVAQIDRENKTLGRLLSALSANAPPRGFNEL